jgi:hypothetical protein
MCMDTCWSFKVGVWCFFVCWLHGGRGGGCEVDQANQCKSAALLEQLAAVYVSGRYEQEQVHCACAAV